MNIKTFLKLSVATLCFVLTAFFISDNVFASGHHGGGSGDDGDCESGSGNLRACFSVGTSWRYYETSSPVTFKGYNGTGGDYTVSDCTKEGGFWFHAFESFKVSNGVKTFNGHQVSTVSKGKAKSKGSPLITSQTPGSVLYSSMHGSYGGANGGRLAKNEAEVKTAYETAKKNLEEQENITDWPNWNDYYDLVYFCYSPENAAYAAQSEVSIAGGSSSKTSWSSADNTGSPARKTATEGDDVAITFTHRLKKEGVSGVLNGTTFSVVTNGTTAVTNQQYTENGPTDVYQETIHVAAPSNNKSYCSTITYDNKAVNGSKTVKSTICAEISSQPRDVEAKTATVTFSANSQVQAAEDFQAINEYTGEEYTIRANDILGVSSSSTLEGIKNLTEIPVITVIDEWVPLKFSHVVTRTDSSTGVSKAYTHTILTPPSASLTLDNVGTALKKALFKSENILDKLKKIFSGETKLSDLFKKGTSTAESGTLIQRALEEALGRIDVKDSDYFTHALKLRTEDLEIGGSDNGYTTSGKYKATGDGKDYCQMLIYQNSRLVYEDDNEAPTLTGIPFLDKMLALLVDGGKLTFSLVQSLISGGEVDAALYNNFWNSLSDFGKVSMEYFSSFLQDVINNGNLPVSGACVKLKKSFDFNIDSEPQINDDKPAIVGETISLTPNSTVTSKPLHSDLVTDTSELQIRVIKFWTDNNQAYNLTGNYTKESEKRGTADPCAYYEAKAAAKDCNTVNESNGQVLYRSDSEGGLNKLVVRKLSQLGLGSGLSATVPDVEVGSLFCFAIGVKDSDSDSKNLNAGRWAISNATCRTVAKKPSLQVWGSSTYSEGDITTSLTSKNSLNFGSWSEYMAISYNKISGFSSGNALNIANNDDFSKGKNSPLTITNGNKDDLGKSGITANAKLLERINEVYRDAAKSSDASGSGVITSCDSDICYKHYSGDVDISGSDISGTTVVYSEGNITIVGNLTYNSAPISNINNVPQVIVISEKDIKINSNVSQVDAWLIAGGKLDTCADKSDDFNKEENKFSAEACKTVTPTCVGDDDIGTEVHINGPVITSNNNGTDKNLNYRTGGSGVGDNSAKSAEVFNLPASTYLWAYSQAIKNGKGFYEVYRQELAPRL